MSARDAIANGVPSPEVQADRSAARTVLPLENGDRLTRAEFERRYEAMPHVKKAELIEGEVQRMTILRARRN